MNHLKQFLIGLLCSVVTTVFLPVQASDNPNLSALSSLIIPGSAQWVHDEEGKGSLHFISFSTGVMGSGYYSDRSDYLSDSERYNDDKSTEYINSTSLKAGLFDGLLLNTMFYSSYDAYSDIRYQETKTKKASLGTLAASPFQWEYLSRPTTYVPLILIAAASSQEKFTYQSVDSTSKGEMAMQAVAVNTMTAVGEEAFFRGYMNHELSYQLGENWAIGLSSVGFGLAHNGEGDQADQLTAAAIGGYLAWLHQSNHYQMGENIALHYWINMISDLAAISRGKKGTLLSLGYPF